MKSKERRHLGILMGEIIKIRQHIIGHKATNMSVINISKRVVVVLYISLP